MWYDIAMNFEKMSSNRAQSAEETQETEEFNERLSSDYQNIRNDAVALIDQRILLMKDELGPDAPEIAKYEAAKEKLRDDQYVLNAARANNWQHSREWSSDIEEEDKKLANGLMLSVLALH
jgi:hypothetical protein